MSISLNWKNTQQQTQPTSMVGFAEAVINPRIIPAHIFPFDDGPGIDPVDVIKGATLGVGVGVSDEDYSFGAPSYGMYDGVDHTSRTALEISTSAGGVACSDNSFLDPLHESFGIYLQYRIVEGDSGTTVSIVRKGGNHVTPALGDVTWQLHYDETTHRVYMSLAYNSTAAGSFTANAYVDGTVDDACHHWLYAKINFTNQTVSVFGDTGVGTSTSITTMLDALVAEGEQFSNSSDATEFGNNSDLSSNDNPIQLSYMAVFRGRASDLFERTHGQSLWVHGRCQNIIDTGYEIAYTRTTRAAYPIAADKVAMWSGSDGGGTVQVPLEFNAGWSGTDFLQLGCHPTTSNRITYPNRLSQWSGVSALTTGTKLVSERGFREMAPVDATANGGYVHRTVVGLTAETTYRVSWYARTQTGSHDARVEVTLDDLTTTLASLEPSLTTTRTRNTFTFTTAVGQTQLRLKLFGGITTTQTTTGYHGIMLTQGTSYGPVVYNDINQDGSGEALASQTQVLTVVGNELTSPDEGSIYAAYIQSVQDTGDVRSICEIHSALGNEDRRVMRILANGAQESVTYDGSGANYQTSTAHVALSANTAYNRSTKWRRKANLKAGAYTLEDNITTPAPLVQTVGGTANTEGSGGHTRIFIACRATLSGQLSGLQTLTLHAGERREFAPAAEAINPVASSFTSQQGASGGGGGVTDHGALLGLADDDHTQYLRADGTRPSTGLQVFSAGISLGGNTASDILIATDVVVSTSDIALVTAGYLDGLYLRDTDAYDHPNHSGDVTSVADGAQTIAVGVVTNAKLATVGTQTFKGRVAGGVGSPEDLTTTQATAMLNNFTPTLKGLAPLSGGGTANFLRADGTWAAPGVVADHGALTGLADDDHTQYLRVDGTRASTGLQTFSAGISIGGNTLSDVLISTDVVVSTSNLAIVTAGYLDGLYLRDTDAYAHPNHSGDVTSVGDGPQLIAANAVTNAKAAQMLANTVKSNATAGTANASDLAMGSSTMLARLAAGNIVAATPTQVRTLLNVADGANSYTHPNHSGDVTSVGDGAVTINIATVTNAKLAGMSSATIKGRITGGMPTAAPVDLTATQATTILNNFTPTLKGLAPLSGGGTANFLRADGAWAAPAPGGVTAHSALTGLAADDHTQYLRTDGTRASTGAQTFSAGVSIPQGVFLYLDDNQNSGIYSNGDDYVQLVTGNTWRLACANAFIAINSAIVRPNVDYLTGAVDLGTSTQRFQSVYARNGQFEYDAVGVTETEGIVNRNKTLATAGVQQYSPMTVHEGSGWKADWLANGNVGPEVLKIANQLEAVASLAGDDPPAINYSWKASIESVNAGAYANILELHRNPNGTTQLRIGPTGSVDGNSLALGRVVDNVQISGTTGGFNFTISSGVRTQIGTSYVYQFGASSVVTRAAYGMVEADTGLYHPATDNAGILTGGVERQRWTDNATNQAVSTISRASLGEASLTNLDQVALRLANTTASTAGSYEASPAILFEGTSWDGVSASETNQWFQRAISVENALGSDTHAIQWSYRTGTTTPAPKMSIDLAGKLVISGDFEQQGTRLGFYGTAPTTQSAAYSTGTFTNDRSITAATPTNAELGRVLKTLIEDLKDTGIIG